MALTSLIDGTSTVLKKDFLLFIVYHLLFINLRTTDQLHHHDISVPLTVLIMLLITHSAEKHFRYIFQQLPQYIKQNSHLRSAVKNALPLPSFVFARLLSLPTFYQMITYFLHIINSYFSIFQYFFIYFIQLSFNNNYFFIYFIQFTVPQ